MSQKMRYYYKSKNTDFYNPSLLDNPFFWGGVSLAGVGVGVFAVIKGIKSTFIVYLIVGSMLVLSGLVFWQGWQIKKYLGTIKRFFSYLVNYDLVCRLDRAMLDSRNRIAMKVESYRVLPKIWLYYEDYAFHIKIQKLAGSYSEDLDHLGEIVSSVLGDRYYLASKDIDRSGSWYEFICPKVEEQLQWTPFTSDLVPNDPYHVKLMNGLVLEFEKLPHLAIFGATGSRKTTTMLAVVGQELGRSECYFLDGKNEFAALKIFMSSKYFAESEDEIFNLMDRLLDVMSERKKILAEEVKRRGVMGLTAHDIGLKPIFLFIDEYASVKARCGKSKSRELDSLLLQALMQFRSLGMYVIYASQSPSTTVLSTQMREAFSTYVLLGTANGDTQRMTFGQVATTGTVPVGEGYYLSKVATMPTPQLFVVPNLVKNRVLSIQALKWLYNQGKNWNRERRN